MKRIIYPLLISVIFITGCGDSYYSARNYLKGPVDGIGLKSSTSLVSGGTEQLFPVVSPPDTANKSIIWTSSDYSVVSVDSSGVITGVATPAHWTTETAVITATTAEGGYSAQCTVTVSEKRVAITGVTISQSTMTLHEGTQGQLTATVAPADATNQNLTWTSSNSSKVTVDASGLVTAITAGTAIVTVTTVDGSYKASCIITSTTDPVYTVTYDSNTATDGSVPEDSTSYLSGSAVTVMDKNTLVKTNYNFTGWNTSENGSGTVYAVGSSLTITSSDVTLYAMWTPVPVYYKVNYHPNTATGGTAPEDSNDYISGAIVTVMGRNTLVKTNYNFTGWNTSENGSGLAYVPGQPFIMGNTEVELYAQWTAVNIQIGIQIIAYYNGSDDDSTDGDGEFGGEVTYVNGTNQLRLFYSDKSAPFDALQYVWASVVLPMQIHTFNNTADQFTINFTNICEYDSHDPDQCFYASPLTLSVSSYSNGDTFDVRLNSGVNFFIFKFLVTKTTNP
jgi:uncharacterized repeat protein (TIGR02543 family)